jgi:virginiamycin B lyase
MRFLLERLKRPDSGHRATQNNPRSEISVWFTDVHAYSVDCMTIDGTTTFFPTATQGTSAYGIAAGPDGNIWYTIIMAGKLGCVTPTGTVTEYTIPTQNSYPQLMAAGPDGNVWFVETGANKVAYIVL